MANELRERSDNAIRHQIDLERYKTGESARMKNMLEVVNDDVNAQFKNLEEKIAKGMSKAFYTKDRLENLSNDLEKLIKNGFVDIHLQSSEDNRNLVDNEIEFTADVLLQGLERVTVPTTRQVFSAISENPFEGWVEQGKKPMTYVDSSPLRGVEKQYIKDMEKSLKSSYLAGATTKDAEKRLQKINDSIAIRNRDYKKARRNTESETRTAIQTYANYAMEETIRENGIEWELFLATLDLRTTEICSVLDQSRWELEDDSRPQIPVHWGCRSIYVPLFSEDEKLEGIRPQVTPGVEYQKGDKYTSNGKIRKPRRSNEKLSRSGISTDMDFNSWLERQDRTDSAFVKDYFGSNKKYEDWKAGKLGKVSYYDISGKKHDINSLRSASIGDSVKEAPALSMRSSNPSKYFISKGKGKAINKRLNSWADETDLNSKLKKEQDILNNIEKSVIGRRVNNSARRKIAEEMLENINIVGSPKNTTISVNDFKKEFTDAVALYGSKIEGIKEVRFVSRGNSRVKQGILVINNNVSNVYKEVGRFISNNDNAYFEGSKYFQTTRIPDVVAKGFDQFKNSNFAFSLYKADPERFNFILGIIDDKPKNIKVDPQIPRLVTKKVSKRAAKKTTKKVSKRAAKKTTKKVSKRAAKKTTKKVSKRATKKVSKRAAKKITKKVAKKVSKKITKKVAKKAVKKIAIKDIDNKEAASAQYGSLNQYIKLGSNTLISKQLAELEKIRKDFNREFKKEMQRIGETNEAVALSRFNTGQETYSVKASQLSKMLDDKFYEVQNTINEAIIENRINRRLPKFRKVTNAEIISETVSTSYGDYEQIWGTEFNIAKENSAQAMALVNHKPDTFRKLVKQGDRASASDYWEFINIGVNSKRVIFHELGHHVEFSNFNIKEAANQFLEKRNTGGTKKLKDIYPNRGYQDNEIVITNGFVHPYVGKLYSDKSTEVISMGLERFTNTNDIMTFYEQDSEHFNFILGIIVNNDKL